MSGPPCQLFVEQPPNTPTVTRANGNTVWGQGTLRLTAPASGNWVVYFRARINFRPQGSSVWTEVTYAEQATSISHGSPIGFTYSTGLAQASLQPRGNGEYQVTISSHGTCGGTSNIPLTPPGGTVPSPVLPVLRPTITTDGILGVWWFGAVGKDDDPNGYYSSVAISGNSNWAGTLTYTITQGSTKVQLTCTNCNNTVAQAIAPSGMCGQDVTITASANGFAAADPVRLMVNRPAGRYSQFTYYNSPIPGGYWSKDHFTFTDLCTMSMSSVAHRESFPGGIKSYWPGGYSSFWSSTPEAHGWSRYRVDQWVTYDDIQVACADADCVPQSTNPSPAFVINREQMLSLMQQPIIALQQMWWAGDSVTGGQLANQCNQTLYRDHAEDINYW